MERGPKERGQKISVLAVGTREEDRVVVDLIMKSRPFQIIGTVGSIKNRSLLSYFRNRDIPVFLSLEDIPEHLTPQVVLDFSGQFSADAPDTFSKDVKCVDSQVLGLFKVLISAGLTASLDGQQTWLQELYRQSRDGFVKVDMTGHFLECNPAFEDLLGYSLAELRDMTLWEVTPEKWQVWERKEIIEKQVLPRGYSDLFEKEYRRRDGSVIPIEIQAYLIKDEQGRPQAIWGVVRGIAERKRSQQDLEESEKKFRTIVEQTGQMIYDYDIRSGKISWSGAVTQISGLTVAEIDLWGIEGWEDSLHPDDRERIMAQLAEVQNRGGLFHVFYRFRHKDGTYRFIEEQGVFLRDEDGVACRMLGTMSDVTERALAEDQLKRNLADLQRFKKATVDRELRMIALKKQINTLCQELGRPSPYDLSFLD